MKSRRVIQEFLLLWKACNMRPGELITYDIPYLRSRCHINDNGCWEWEGALESQGYGYVGPNYTGTRLVHRVMYILTFGEASKDLEIDHLCRNKKCCNPDHLELVTKSVNQLRRYAASPVVACRKGHEFVEGSYYVYGGKRACKECARARDKVNNVYRTARRRASHNILATE